MYPDIVQISNRINIYLDIKQKNTEERNENDHGFLSRLRNFRNLQKLDPNFLKQKERLLWPLYEFKQKPSLGAMKNQQPTTINDQGAAAESEAKIAKRLGKNPKLF
jgi:hypothetical protein